MGNPSEFWDALAPHHSKIENSYFDLPSLRRLLRDIREPVLVVGAGQGLIVAELLRKGFHCDGVDFSAAMIRYAKARRGLDLVQADAKAMPFPDGTYNTVICATGVVDFTSDEADVRAILNEVRRVANPAGSILIGFYRISPATEAFLKRLGLLKDHILCHKETLEIYRLKPVQTIAWVARRARVSLACAAIMALRSWACSSWQEKRNAFHMQRIFAQVESADTLIRAAPEQQACRSEAEIQKLFTHLAIPLKQLQTFSSCYVAHILPHNKHNK